MAVLCVLFDDWLKRRQMLTALGVEAEAVDVLEDALTPDRETAPAAADPDARRRQVEAFIAAAGGA